MNKLKFSVFGGAVVVIAAISMLAAQADTTPLAVSCSGSVSNNVVTWIATSTGGTAPVSFVWSGNVGVAGSTSTSIMATYTTNDTYTSAIQATDASSSIATSTCTATVTSNVVVTPTSTPPRPPLPRVNQPSLSIGPNGNFLAHGMTVTSVASDSFQGEVWGITYTVNWANIAFPEFYMRLARANASSSINPSGQLAVGDEVGVSGFVNGLNPMVVNANVVRDYSITNIWLPGLREGQPGSPFYNGEGDGGGNGNGNGRGDERPAVSSTVNSSVSASGSVDFQNQINNILDQLKNLQNLFHGQSHGNDNGKGNVDH